MDAKTKCISDFEILIGTIPTGWISHEQIKPLSASLFNFIHRNLEQDFTCTSFEMKELIIELVDEYVENIAKHFAKKYDFIDFVSISKEIKRSQIKNIALRFDQYMEHQKHENLTLIYQMRLNPHNYFNILPNDITNLVTQLLIKYPF